MLEQIVGNDYLPMLKDNCYYWVISVIGKLMIGNIIVVVIFAMAVVGM